MVGKDFAMFFVRFMGIGVILCFLSRSLPAFDSEEAQEIEIIKGLQPQGKTGSSTNKAVAEVRVWAKKAPMGDQKKDEAVGGQTDKAAEPESQPAVKNEAKTDPVPLAGVPSTEKEIEKPETVRKTAEPAVTIQDLAALSNALQKKQDELSNAKKQINDLKVTVRKMLEASRRERLSLLNNLACAYEAGGEYKKAEAKFLEALEINGDDSDIVYNLAILYDEDLKDKKKAKQYYQRFLQLPGDPRDKEMVRAWLEGMKSDRTNQERM
jgi:tetratricopeptide (TPR) repeat protein